MSHLYWLASYPKSGNTWLRALLANWFVPGVGLNDLASAGLGLQDTHAPCWQRFFREVPDWPTQQRFRCVVQRLMAKRHGVTFCKTHSAFGTCGGYPLHDPDITAGAVYIVRDPRDVALSYARHFDVPIDDAVDHMCAEDMNLETRDGYFQYLGTWSQHVASWGGVGLVVKYEDMLARPNKVFGRILRHMGLVDVSSGVSAAREAQTAAAVDAASFDRLRRAEELSGFKEAWNGRFFGTGGSTWREFLDPVLVRRIEDAHGDVMTKLGYL